MLNGSKFHNLILVTLEQFDVEVSGASCLESVLSSSYLLLVNAM